MDREGSFDRERQKNDLEVWKVALNTQMHFNDLLIKMRTAVISIILAVFGASAFVVRNVTEPIVTVCNHRVHASSLVLAIGIIFLVVQFLIDRCYYFNLLLGAVDFTKNLDGKYKKEGLFGLTEAIIGRIDEKHATRVLIAYYFTPIVLAILVIILIQSNPTAFAIK